jgi:hypothetical protein
LGNYREDLENEHMFFSFVSVLEDERRKEKLVVQGQGKKEKIVDGIVLLA